MLLRLASFSWGRRSYPCTVSTSIPWKVSEVVGPSVFSGATAKPSSSQRAKVVVSQVDLAGLNQKTSMPTQPLSVAPSTS